MLFCCKLCIQLKVWRLKAVQLLKVQAVERLQRDLYYSVSAPKLCQQHEPFSIELFIQTAKGTTYLNGIFTNLNSEKGRLFIRTAA